MSKKEKKITLPPELENYTQSVIATGSWLKSSAALAAYAFSITFINPELASGKPEIEADAHTAAIDKTEIARKHHSNPDHIPTLFFGFDVSTSVNGTVLHKLSREMKFGDKKKMKRAREEAIHLFSEQDELVVDWIYCAAMLSYDDEIRRVAALNIQLRGEPIPKSEIVKAFKDKSVMDRNTRVSLIENAKRYRGEEGSLMVQDGFDPDGIAGNIRRKRAEKIIVGNVMPQVFLDQLANPVRLHPNGEIPAQVVSLNLLHGIMRV